MAPMVFQIEPTMDHPGDLLLDPEVIVRWDVSLLGGAATSTLLLVATLDTVVVNGVPTSACMK